jgi:anti-sigma B factor antagonist
MAASPSIPVPELQLTTERSPDRVVVHGTGRINASTADQLQSTIRSLIHENKRVVVDLTGVEYIDSSGLGALVSIYLAAGRADCLLELQNPKQRIRDLFKLTKLASLFDTRTENYFGDF